MLCLKKSHALCFVSFHTEIPTAPDQNPGRLLLLHKRRAQGTARPRRAQRAHGTVHGQSHQVRTVGR